MVCAICNHPKREEIEHKLACRTMGDLSITIESVAKEYGIKPIDLQVHAMMHATLPVAENTGDEKARPATLVESVRFKEAELLRQSASEYQNTLSLLGTKIRELVREHSDDHPTLQKISRPTVDLYLGLGGEIRGAVDSLVRMNNLINGDQSSGVQGLADLVKAVNVSAAALNKSEADSDD